MSYYQAEHLHVKENVKPGSITWRSPSNIALIKYWGKYGTQLPQNPSLSFTLQQAYSETTIIYKPKDDEIEQNSARFTLDGQTKPNFAARINAYLVSLRSIFPFIDQLTLEVKSSNSFPHSVGIASSASGMSALALCLCALEHELFGTLQSDEAFRQKASYIARLGSGSACRSIYGKHVLWGKTGLVSGATNEYAIPIKDGIHPIFESYRDAILIVDRAEKKVSSSVGHGLMEQHPFAKVRYEEARRNLHKILEAMRSGNLEDFGRICESEALQLHALMMCSNPSYILMHPNTLKIINLIREFRHSTQLPVYFTIDAGPNIHMLYPSSCKDETENFINDVLVGYCVDGAWISDQVGLGPIQI